MSGTVVKSEWQDAALDNDAGIELTLKFDAIQNIKSGAELHVTVKGGRRW